MRFLLMLYAEEKAGAAIPPEQMARAMEGMYAYQQALEKAGAFISTSALGMTQDARTLRMDGGEVKNIDGAFINQGGTLKVEEGPYAEAREQFGGLFVIECEDMDAAVKWAARCPAAQWGPIEIRPIMNTISANEAPWCAEGGSVTEE
ncbi:YciI family protein [Devosia sp.]|uniref:YciI family protein n=1 Tax=Devosia sp. TaxID=1871048 RepID=UPI0025F4E3ED|nr:YciI family protein [Devosia sp.]MCR6635157.1 YciI family protein [Devosia sp.]